MAYSYLREESIGFLNEYLSEYTPTTKRAWDDNEEATMYDEILEGRKCDRVMSDEFQKLIHAFILDNIEPMECYRRYIHVNLLSFAFYFSFCGMYYPLLCSSYLSRILFL